MTFIGHSKKQNLKGIKQIVHVSRIRRNEHFKQKYLLIQNKGPKLAQLWTPGM